VERGDAVRTYKTRRRLTPGQAQDLERLLPRYGVEPTPPFDAERVFGRSGPVVLEIGCGNGEATVAMARAEPDRDVLAIETHVAGVASLLRRVEEWGLMNVRVLEADALLWLRQACTPAVLDEVRVFFPDPWSKARHAKRRMVVPAFADLVADRLHVGGRLHVATDCVSYAEQATEVLDRSAYLEVVSRSRGVRPVTRFERRGLAAGRPSHDVIAVRTA